MALAHGRVLLLVVACGLVLVRAEWTRITLYSSSTCDGGDEVQQTAFKVPSDYDCKEAECTSNTVVECFSGSDYKLTIDADDEYKLYSDEDCEDKAGKVGYIETDTGSAGCDPFSECCDLPSSVYFRKSECDGDDTKQWTCTDDTCDTCDYDIIDACQDWKLTDGADSWSWSIKKPCDAAYSSGVATALISVLAALQFVW
eukprot:TRINITY_DN17635_c0_g1_i1.p1 TRINITY_DN17635_c0_g1~~TRINITY_DN17635_c0_g1_i1.p1  ORF type:complete len:200 (+),score=53.81 TRINITY_DN17635_c0_g1_i1:15-614(+)